MASGVVALQQFLFNRSDAPQLNLGALHTETPCPIPGTTGHQPRQQAAIASGGSIVLHIVRLQIAAATLAFGFASAAIAADMPLKAPAEIVSQGWTGFYAGLNVGTGWGNRSMTYSANDPAAGALFSPAGLDAAPPPASFSSNGALGGLQFGYNWQLNRNWLVGVEADYDWSGIKGSSTTNGLFFGDPLTTNVDERIKWFGTARLRLGYLPTDNLLTYVTGGWAYGRVEHSGSYGTGATAGIIGIGAGGFTITCTPGTTCLSGSSSHTESGWTAGAGFEYAFWKNVTFKAEYLYVNLGSGVLTERSRLFTPGTQPGAFNADFGQVSFNVARVGLNFRF